MNILIEKLKQRNAFSTTFLYIIYFLLGMYYPLFSFMRQTVPQYWGQVTLFYHILLILLLAKVLLQKNSVFDWIFLAGLFYLCYKSYQYNYDSEYNYVPLHMCNAYTCFSIILYYRQ